MRLLENTRNKHKEIIKSARDRLNDRFLTLHFKNVTEKETTALGNLDEKETVKEIYALEIR